MAEKLTKNERREQAREQARLAREAEKKREKRTRLMWQGGIVVAVLAVIGVVALVLSQSMKPAGPGPENMASGGVTFGADLEVVPTPALGEGESREAIAVDRTELPIDVSVYNDYICSHCGLFEQTWADKLEPHIGSGDITFTVTPLNIFDTQSLGTKYSSRAGNILACVVEQQPEAAYGLHNGLLSANVQPAMGTTGLTDDQLLEQAELAGAELTDDLKRCVKNQTFASFISGNTKQVQELGVLGLAEGERLLMSGSNTELQPEGPQLLTGTPLVLVNGKQWIEGRDGDLEVYILKLKAEIEAQTAKGEADEADDEADAE